ncbi:hypothetical protein BD289DRAFT_485286 [Coniella lustricola]|uniref:FAD/NAD(P)-binding domain-containing protein n=1 Tax=Coniella lustricola TaxID=2025994 RepID=A0A2T2ZZA5_9PEZI|nr:hypothetical protein BD289DRAFT_485286 [Coniella lustricola]
MLSVIVVGSANSAFDVIDDTATAGLTTTMVARSPTYVFPWAYAQVRESLGLYEVLPAALADKLLMTGPTAVDGQLVRGLYQALARKEPARYQPLAAAGFPVYDSLDGRTDLMMHITERGGGHFNDIGNGVALIVAGKVAVKAGVAPVAYEEGGRGLVFADGSVVRADAIVWCTGFRDKDRGVTAEVLGGKMFVDDDDDDDGNCGGDGGGVVGGDEEGVSASASGAKSRIIGPHEVAALRDGVWGVDKEGEIRGCFERHLRVDNYWITGGTTTQHRLFSLPIALQIKAALEGVLPAAWRETPEL